MATDTAPSRRARLRRPSLPTLLIAAFAVVLTTAAVVNGVQTVRDNKRVKVDKKVAKRWFGAHASLGRFGPARLKVGGDRDMVCRARSANSGAASPVDGYCIVISARSTGSTEILASYRCFYPRAAARGLPTQPRCLPRHGG
ncbi:MAG: hypothetical protein QOE06_2062 [Thermoleophilaceae bacterium]|jgi:hypothetical protein|nr:hypothetical protein [Thermoleophilaceae bacterium]